MLNSCEFIGHLGRDPEIRTTQSGDKVANISLAVSEKWRDRNSGERKERTEWVRLVIFGNLVDIAEQYLRKGSKAYFRGRLASRKWQDQSGQDKYTTEIILSGYDGKLVMLDGAPKSDDGYTDDEAAYKGSDPAKQGPLPGGGPDPIDDIPFAPLRELP